MPFRDKAYKERPPSRCSKPINYLRDLIDPQVNNQTLLLNDYLIADDGVSYVSDILYQNAHYRVFECDSNRVTSPGLNTLSKALNNQSMMEYINLKNNEVANNDNNGLETLADSIKNYLPKLQRLNLSKNNLDVDCIEIIIQILNDNKGLKLLDLSWNFFEDEQVYKIIDRVDKEKLKNIKIDLTGNPVKQSLRDKLGLADINLEPYPRNRDEEKAHLPPLSNDNNMFLDFRSKTLRENVDKTMGILPHVQGATNSRISELELLLSEQRKRNFLQREHQKEMLKTLTNKGKNLDEE